MFAFRLPIVQGGTFTFVTPSIAILSLPHLRCPTPPTPTATVDPCVVHDVTMSMNMSDDVTATMPADVDTDEIWHIRMREVFAELNHRNIAS